MRAAHRQFGSEVISCGSPFVVNKEDLTNFGIGDCEASGGLATRRAFGIAFMLAGAVLMIGGWIASEADETARAKSRSATKAKGSEQ